MADEQQTLLDEQALAEATNDPAARIDALRREIEPVSYTHLDVYKRQAVRIRSAGAGTLSVNRQVGC